MHISMNFWLSEFQASLTFDSFLCCLPQNLNLREQHNNLDWGFHVELTNHPQAYQTVHLCTVTCTHHVCDRIYRFQFFCAHGGHMYCRKHNYLLVGYRNDMKSSTGQELKDRQRYLLAEPQNVNMYIYKI